MSQGINLLPWREERKAKRNYYFRLQLVFILIIMVVAGVLWHVRLKQNIINLQEKKIFLKPKYDLIEKMKRDINMAEQLLKKAEKEQLKIKELRNDRSHFVDILNALNQKTPENICFSRLSIDHQKVTIAGKARSLADLELLINHSGLGEKPVIKVINWESGGYNFELKG